jgi:sterol desaturase/sphingolipid hydroxylase (fatty acid hydroxylase superfamily)
MGEIELGAVRQLLLFLAILTPLELCFPGHRAQRLLRRGLGVDIVFALVSPLILALLLPLVFDALEAGIGRLLPEGLGATLRGQPRALQLGEILLLGEVSGYWLHRWSHEVPLLWRFHRVHHTNLELDWVAAHRQHPLETAYLLVAANLPALVLGFSSDSVLELVLLQKLYTAFLHANLGFGFGPLGRWLASPRFHRWHHDGEGAAANFASFLSCLDRLWGTHRLGPALPARYGIVPPSGRA